MNWTNGYPRRGSVELTVDLLVADLGHSGRTSPGAVRRPMCPTPRRRRLRTRRGSQNAPPRSPGDPPRDDLFALSVVFEADEETLNISGCKFLCEGPDAE